MAETDLDKWHEIAEKVQKQRNKTVKLINVLNEVPKTVWRDELDSINEAFNDLRNALEYKMREEHPGEDCDIFY